MTIWLAIFFLLVFALGFYTARVRDQRSEYNRGYLAGRSEERSHVNARCMRRKMQNFRDASEITRWAIHSRN